MQAPSDGLLSCEINNMDMIITQPTCSVQLNAILFETTQFAVTNLKIKVLNPTVKRHIMFTGISTTQTKDKWNVKTKLPTQHV